MASDGTLWVGTHAGLSRVIEDRRTAIRFAHPLAEALRDRPVPVVFSIAEAPRGALWLGTDNGMVRFDTRDERYRFYGLADGLQDLEFNGGAVAALGDGRLAFGGVRGFNLFDPRQYRRCELRAAAAPAVGPHRRGRLGRQRRALWQPQAAVDPRWRRICCACASARSISRPPPTSSIAIAWTASTRAGSTTASQQDITYTRLPPGDYIFRAQATNRDGVWSSQELSMPGARDAAVVAASARDRDSGAGACWR